MQDYGFKKMSLSDQERKKRGWKFWLVFWTISIILLVGWAAFLHYKNEGLAGFLGIATPVIGVLPIEDKQKEEARAILEIFPAITGDGQEKNYLILFQNNMELRPGGGFIGAFGILKTKGEKVQKVEVHDTNVFDSRISTGIEPPYPMGEMLNISNWEMRDSNWSPDFPTNAQKAIELYQAQGGSEKFDGVAAISTEVLTSFLEIIGPVQIEGYPGEYNSENAITKLEYQVEMGYKEQDIEKGKRKYIMKDMAREILERAQDLTWREKKDLLFKIEEHLNQKDVMVYFEDEDIQRKINKINWTGEVEEQFKRDYIMMVDANLGALKTDLHMKREMEYTIDLSKEKPEARLEVTYHNTARARDWMTSDYKTYLRVYTPQESWLTNASEVGATRFGEEFNKKYFGTIVEVPINSTKTVTFDYELPSKVAAESYNLMIQKQSGVNKIPITINLIDEKGLGREYKTVIDSDWQLFKD